MNISESLNMNGFGILLLILIICGTIIGIVDMLIQDSSEAKSIDSCNRSCSEWSVLDKDCFYECLDLINLNEVDT